MAAKNFIRFALVSLLTLTLVFLMVPMAFATESETVAETVTEAVTDAVTEEVASDDSAAVETEAATDSSAETGEASEEKSEDTEAATETGDVTTTGTEETDGITTGDIVSIVIVAVIVIGAAVYCIKNKAKVAEFFRNVKSECKKIVWTPWKTVRKNTVVVVIIVIVCAIVIGLLDFIFAKGIVSLGDLF